MTAIGPYVEGEIPEPLEYQFLDADGAAIDLTGFTATFSLRIGSAATVELDATITTPLEGRVTHTWLVDELTVGSLRAEFWVEDATNRYVSDRLTSYVHPPV